MIHETLATRQFITGSLLGLILLFTASDVHAQARKLAIPKPEEIPQESLGLTLHCMYFPGGFVQKSETEVVTKPGKEVVPIIILHGFEGRGADCYPLALALQRQGHAVVVPDLRGHGASNKIKGRDGSEKEIDLDKMRTVDFAAMVGDVEVLKRFLYEKNNQGLVNIEMLCLIGADLGGLVAANWVAMDWSRRDLPAFKQGKSVKALVILSPLSSIKGYNATSAWKHPVFQSNLLSIMLVAGRRDTKSYNEAKQIYNRIERHHPLPQDPSERVAKQSLFFIDPDTELSGTQLLDPRSRLPVGDNIVKFVGLRLVNRMDEKEFAWAERKNPLSQ